MGSAEAPPPPPLNVVGDFGGGGMLFAFGVLCGLFEARNSGRGQVVDSAMLDGSNLLGAMIHGFLAYGAWREGRGTNIVAGGSHFYGTYACADGKYVCVGAIEPHFYALLLERCGVAEAAFLDQMNEENWPALKEKMAALFRTRTRDEWCALLEGTDACFAPVLDLHEAPGHAQNLSRDNFIDVDGVLQPAPGPRFSRTAASVCSGPATPGQHTEEILEAWGVPQALIERVYGATCGDV
jgi:alpha-methylacyl-CoA racemase